MVPSDPKSTTGIAAVSYAGDMALATISQDAKSFSIQIKNGSWKLYVFLHSADQTDGSVQFQQTNGAAVTVLEPDLPIRNQTAIWFQDVVGV
jgi:hypothetical protein